MPHKHALFLIHRFVVGGVETLMSRLARHLMTEGWSVTILTGSVASGADHIVPAGVELRNLGTALEGLKHHSRAEIVVRDAGLPHVDLVFTGDPWSCWMGCIVSTVLPERPAMLCGVYQPNEYFYPARREFFRSSYGETLRSRNFDRNVPDESKVFTCDWVRKSHGRSFGRSLESAGILLLPVDASLFNKCVRKPDRHKIVSVGRLTKWKSYNFQMIPIIRNLAAKGIPVTWHVYGEGESMLEMKQAAQAHGVDDRIFFHGTVNYDELWRVMEDAGVFVGMGTTMLEAAICCVPTVPAIARLPEPMTYGAIHEFPLGCTGELDEAEPCALVQDVIERIIQMTEPEYTNEMQRTRNYVRPFEMENVSDEFIRLVENARPGLMPQWQALAYRTHERYMSWRARRSTT